LNDGFWLISIELESLVEIDPQCYHTHTHRDVLWPSDVWVDVLH
jgi:hypothetical protein